MHLFVQGFGRNRNITLGEINVLSLIYICIYIYIERERERERDRYRYRYIGICGEIWVLPL